MVNVCSTPPNRRNICGCLCCMHLKPAVVHAWVLPRSHISEILKFCKMQKCHQAQVLWMLTRRVCDRDRWSFFKCFRENEKIVTENDTCALFCEEFISFVKLVGLGPKAAHASLHMPMGHDLLKRGLFKVIPVFACIAQGLPSTGGTLGLFETSDQSLTSPRQHLS